MMKNNIINIMEPLKKELHQLNITILDARIALLKNDEKSYQQAIYKIKLEKKDK